MRERDAWWLQRTGALSAVMGLRRHAPAPMLSIVTYHHIADHDPAYPYDPNVADAAPMQFRRQMETIDRYGTPIGIDDLIRAVGGPPPPPTPARGAAHRPVARRAPAPPDGDRISPPGPAARVGPADDVRARRSADPREADRH